MKEDTSQSVKVRAFQSSDLEDVVTLHEKCFKPDENFSLRMGREFLRLTYQFFLNDEKSFGLVAFHEGKLVGFVVGRLDYFLRDLGRYRMSAGLWTFLKRPWVLFDKQLLRRSLKLIPNYLFNTGLNNTPSSSPFRTDGKISTLASLGIAPTITKLRISDRLLDAAEEYCGHMGRTYLRAGVFPTNIEARFMHRRRGYVEEKALRNKTAVFYYLNLSRHQPEKQENAQSRCS